MSKKINTLTISATATKNFRLFMYPADAMLNFWKGLAKDTLEEYENLTTKEMTVIPANGLTFEAQDAAYKSLCVRFNSEITFWEGVQKERNQAIKDLISKNVYDVLKKAVNEDEEKVSAFDFFLAWFSDLGIEVGPGYENVFRKAVTSILLASNSVMRIDAKGNLSLKGVKTVRVTLINAMIMWLVSDRKQWVVGSSKMSYGVNVEPTFSARTNG